MSVDFAYPRYAEIGRIESEFFQPGHWKPHYPNAAFDKMRADDAFWAARIVARFGDDAIRAIVATGRFDDPEAEEHLAETLIRRRDRIVSHYFRRVNPLERFRIVDSALEFENLGERRGLAAGSRYEYQWYALDNSTSRLTAVGESRIAQQARIPLPAGVFEYPMVRIRTRCESQAGWARAVDVYLRRSDERSYRVVGVERETGEERAANSTRFSPAWK